MQIGHKMTELETFEVLSVVLEHAVFNKEQYTDIVAFILLRF